MPAVIDRPAEEIVAPLPVEFAHPAFGSSFAHRQATPKEIEHYVKSIGLFRNKAKAIHAAMTTVVGALNWAAELDFIPENPIRGMKKPSDRTCLFCKRSLRRFPSCSHPSLFLVEFSAGSLLRLKQRQQP